MRYDEYITDSEKRLIISLKRKSRMETDELLGEWEKAKEAGRDAVL